MSPQPDQKLELDAADALESLQQQLGQKSMDLATSHAMNKKLQRDIAELRVEMDKLATAIAEKEKK